MSQVDMNDPFWQEWHRRSQRKKAGLENPDMSFPMSAPAGYAEKGRGPVKDVLESTFWGSLLYPVPALVSTLAGGAIGYAGSSSFSDSRAVSVGSTILGSIGALILTMQYMHMRKGKSEQQAQQVRDEGLRSAELAASAKAQETLDSFTIEPWSEVTPENEQATLRSLELSDAMARQMATDILLAPDNRSDVEKSADRLKYLNSVKLRLEGKTTGIEGKSIYDPSVLLAIPRECIKREYGKGVIKKTDLICPGKLVAVVQDLMNANMKALNL